MTGFLESITLKCNQTNQQFQSAKNLTKYKVVLTSLAVETCLKFNQTVQTYSD